MQQEGKVNLQEFIKEIKKERDNRQKVTEESNPINLLCIYGHGVEPNVVHLYHGKENVDKFFTDRDNHNLPVYELHIVLNATTGVTSVEIGDRLDTKYKEK